MALPTYNELMLPLLRYIQDGRQYFDTELVPLLQRDFRLSETDLSVTKDGGQPRLLNRMPWARKSLQEAGLLIGLRRFTIAQQGKDTLAANPSLRSVAASHADFS